MRRVLTMLTVALAAIALAVPVSAITDGDLDGNDHDYVGLMVALDVDGNPLWRCTGTMMSPTVFLTAGHCTEAPAASAEIWFDADVSAGRPGNGYPFDGPVSGTTFTHPQFDANAFYLYDLGVVVLDAPYTPPSGQFGALPALNSLDALKKGPKASFTSVGYGLQNANKNHEERALVRMVAYPHLIQINVPGYTGDFSMVLSNNASTGGTCFGDSGGPNFLGDTNVVAAVTSFGKNGNCAGQGGVYRVDRQDDLDWLATFGIAP